MVRCSVGSVAESFVAKYFPYFVYSFIRINDKSNALKSVFS